MHLLNSTGPKSTKGYDECWKSTTENSSAENAMDLAHTIMSAWGNSTNKLFRVSASADVRTDTATKRFKSNPEWM